MRKKLWTIPLTAFAVGLVLMFSACGKPTVEGHIREEIDEAFAEISPDGEGIVELVSGGSNDAFGQLGLDPKDIVKAYFEGFEYEIETIEVDEEVGVAKAIVVVKMKSLSAIMSNFMTEFQAYVDGIDPATVGSEEELYMKAGEILMESVRSAEPSETDCTFEYEKDDEGGWSATEGTENAILEAMA